MLARARRFRRLAAAVAAVAGVAVFAPGYAAAAPAQVISPGPYVLATSPSSVPGAASTYHPVTPFTAYRSNGRIAARHAVPMSLASVGGLPAAGSFSAVAVTVTVTRPTSSTSAAVFAPGTSGRIKVVTVPAKGAATGFTLVPVDSAGRLRARLSRGHANLRVDVDGYLSRGRGGVTFHPLAPASVLQTQGVAGGGTRRVSVVGAPKTGLPPNGRVAAVALAVTATRPTATTTVSAYPRGSRASTAPVVSARRGTTASGLAIVAVGRHGDVLLRNEHGQTRLSAAVEGYWTTDPTGSRFRSVTPTELYGGTTAGNAWRSIRVAGRAGVPSPAKASAAVLSITTGPPSGSATVTVAPARSGFPSHGPITVAAHHTVTTSVLNRLTGRDVHIYSTRRMRLTVSVVGWYGATASGVDVNANSACSTISTGAAFAVIGATTGTPYASPDAGCFHAAVVQAEALPAAPQFYMNLADPGKASAGHWNDGGPRACHVAHNYDIGCAYDYGYRAAQQAVGFASLQGAAAGSRWWVDVEIDNSWGSATIGEPGHRAANVADIQGALKYLGSHGYPTGIYTETAWWGPITGSPRTFSQVPVWGGGAGNPKNARANCKAVSITGGPALLAQWFKTQGGTDHDVAC
jgi:hypothetical protein